MFTVYHANHLDDQKTLLIHLLKTQPNTDPFSSETILVHSVGMAQWLQMQIAKAFGVAGNLEFPFPNSFLWQQYRNLFPHLPKENIFERSAMQWRLFKLIPSQLTDPDFSPLKSYLAQDLSGLKRYQLAHKIADLFDQYNIYRPHWLSEWENSQNQQSIQEIAGDNPHHLNVIEQSVAWQSKLWRALVKDIQQNTDESVFQASQRDYLQQQFFEKLDNLSAADKALLPKRLFIFGISSLPKTQLDMLHKLSEHCDVHLYFINPCQYYWGDILSEKTQQKLHLKGRLLADNDLFENNNELLSIWGKQGKDFLSLLMEYEPNEVESLSADASPNLLSQVKNAMLTLDNAPVLHIENDHSIELHSCHSIMREVEVLHNQLLRLFDEDPTLLPKDIIVMTPKIDEYAPYIEAVFTRYGREDNRHIPFSISDQSIASVEPILSSFLALLNLKESNLTAEEVLGLLNVNAISQKYDLSEKACQQLKEWINSVGIRFGLETEQPHWHNYNSWQNGLSRLLLGTSLKVEQGIWQDLVGFDESYGLSAEIVGKFAKFIEDLTAWQRFITSEHGVAEWKDALLGLVKTYYQETEESLSILLAVKEQIETSFEKITQSELAETLSIEIVAELFNEAFVEQKNSLNFLVGKVNICTLLPMRAIPFKVVCLLGMNEGDFPRQPLVNSFNLMQYSPKKGDRSKRDDDRYLFLEALLSAQNKLYISYIGQSIHNKSEKYPSILVSQLVDYLDKHSEQAFSKQNITQHPMTVFSRKNFDGSLHSYDKEWFGIINTTPVQSEFLAPLPISETVSDTIEIEIDELLAFLQSPTTYFFKNRLGVDLKRYDDELAETEPFSLSGLDKYNLFDEFIAVPPEQEDLFFKQAELQGKLPASHFSQLTQHQLKEQIAELKQTISPYLSQEMKVLSLDFSLEIENKPVRLVGNLPNIIEQKLILWRAGTVKDKYTIKAWLFHLLLCSQALEIEVNFYGYNKEKNGVKKLAFNLIPQAEANQLLACYVSDYLKGFSELQWVIETDIKKYLDKIQKGKSVESEIEALLEKQSSDDKYREKNPYLARILAQTTTIDYANIHQKTTAWFEAMVKNIKKEDK